MSRDRTIDAALGLLVLGQTYEHIKNGTGPCKRCNMDPKLNSKICYAKVPDFKHDFNSSVLLLERLKESLPDRSQYHLDMDEAGCMISYRDKDGTWIISERFPTLSETIRNAAVEFFEIDVDNIINENM